MVWQKNIVLRMMLVIFLLTMTIFFYTQAILKP